MRKQNVFKRFLIVLAFVIFPLTGYFTVSHVTASQAQCAGDCCGACISDAPAPGSLVTVLWEIYNNVIQPAIIQATAILEAYFAPLAIDVWDGMFPVMDWSFREMSDWFDTFWYYNLQPQWQQLTNQLSTANVEQAFALGTFADATNMIRNEGRPFGGNLETKPGLLKQIETTIISTLCIIDCPAPVTGNGYGGDYGIKDHREERPSENVCTAGTMMSSLERANGFSNAVNGAGPADQQWIAENTAGSNSANGQAEYMCNRWDNSTAGCNPGVTGLYGYVPQWCNSSYNDGFAGCAANGNQVNEDVDVAGMIFAQDTIPIDPAQDPPDGTGSGIMKRNLDGMVTNLAEAFVKDPVTAGAAGIDGILQSLSYRAKRQVVYDGLYYVISRRVPGGLGTNSPDTNFVQLLQAIRAETGEDVSTSPDPSRNEVLRAMMTQRYQSGKYALRQIDEPENNEREQVVEQALQLIQMSDQLDLMDHYALLLAAQVSTEVADRTFFISAAEGSPMSNQVFH